LIEILSSPRKHDLHEAELVLSAAGIRHIRRFEAGAHRLYVDEENVGPARQELVEYAAENQRPAEVYPTAVLRDHPWPGIVVYLTVLLVMYMRQHDPSQTFNWEREGMAAAGLIRDGEWWRSITALTLHVDVKHLIGNMFFGSLFGAFLAQVVGGGVAWTTVVLSGALGNFANAWLRDPRQASIGASTAVFGALGALVAWQWTFGRRTQMSWAKRLGPVAAGLMMLAYLGGAEPGDAVDVSAHVTGFLAGVVLGLAHMRWTATRALPRTLQAGLSLTAVALLVLGWSFTGRG
jgi:membrane associated rhomboid family serine protease